MKANLYKKSCKSILFHGMFALFPFHADLKQSVRPDQVRLIKEAFYKKLKKFVVTGRKVIIFFGSQVLSNQKISITAEFARGWSYIHVGGRTYIQTNTIFRIII